MKNNRRNTRTILALAIAGAVLGGCAGTRSYTTYRSFQGNEAAAALPTRGVYGFAGRTDLSDSYWTGSEISRRNRSLSARTVLPFSALGQWPQAIPPRERPIRFERFEQ